MKLFLPALMAASLSSVMFFIFPNGTTSPEQTKTTVMSSEQENAEEWISLFDGKTKNGWHIYNNETNGSAWTVVDGMLFFDPSIKVDGKTAGGDIVTDSSFENYHLVLEWKISQNGNSGMIFNILEDAQHEQSYETGPEMQVLDNSGHPDAKIIKHRAGDLYDLITVSKETVKPWGEWNKAEIKVYKGKLDLYLNGTNVVSTTMWDDNWKALIAGSKFKTLPEFGTIKKGKFGLQDHGNQVWYRNIKIRKL